MERTSRKPYWYSLTENENDSQNELNRGWRTRISVPRLGPPLETISSSHQAQVLDGLSDSAQELRISDSRQTPFYGYQPVYDEYILEDRINSNSYSERLRNLNEKINRMAREMTKRHGFYVQAGARIRFDNEVFVQDMQASLWEREYLMPRKPKETYNELGEIAL